MNFGTFLAAAAAAVSLIGLITLASSYVGTKVGRWRRRRQPRASPLRALSSFIRLVGMVAIAGMLSGAVLLIGTLVRRGRL